MTIVSPANDVTPEAAPGRDTAGGKDSATVTVEFESVDDAAYARMFRDRLDYDHFFDRTEPHLSKEVRTERAYCMRNAIGRIERALEKAGVPSRIYEEHHDPSTRPKSSRNGPQF